MSQENKRSEVDAEINKAPPQPETKTGADTTGVGQPVAQAVNQGQSLPATAIPVDKNNTLSQDKLHDPLATERAALEKDRAERGGQKADF